MKQVPLTNVMFAVISLLAIHAKADISPQNLSELRKSDVIVIGTIKQIRIESEPSQFERGFGNYDWAVYVTLAIELSLIHI